MSRHATEAGENTFVHMREREYIIHSCRERQNLQKTKHLQARNPQASKLQDQTKPVVSESTPQQRTCC